MSSQIVDFYANQTVFLTGITGFLAKVVLIELFTKCPDVSRVYCLVRPQQNLSALERYEKKIVPLRIIRDLFERNPSARDKIVILEGDISSPDFNLSPDVLRTLELETNVILHCAATTKFHETLKTALSINTIGALHILNLAKRCKNLQAYVHVSTAYVNSHHNIRPFDIKEQIYTSRTEVYEALDRINRMSVEEACEKTQSVISPHPNTYTYTKALAEGLLLYEKGDVPVCIVRPSIVGCAYVSPYPGWTDTLIGANGLFYMTALGILHVMHGSRKHVADFIPVDLAATLIIVAAWYTARRAFDPSNSYKFKDNFPIFHSTTSSQNPTTWSTAKNILLNYFKRHPIPVLYGWRPWMFFVPHKPLFIALNILFHYSPALIYDLKLVISGKQPVLFDQMLRLNKIIKSLGYFSSNEWFFSTENVQEVIRCMSKKDLELFPIDPKNLDWEMYLLHYARGMMELLKTARISSRKNLRIKL